MKANRIRTTRRGRRGFAIFMVIMIAFILGSFAALIWHMNRDTKTVREFIVEKKQAEYLAKGAQQHFLLKFRYLPTELYDAVAYSIGKNPYYDFGRPHQALVGSDELNAEDAKVNPGPMFYFGSTSIDIGGDGIPKVDRSGVDLTSISDPDAQKIRTLLKMYLLDVGTLYPTNDDNGIVVITSLAHTDKGMNKDWRDPFVGNYAVQNATILGLSGGKRYDKDSLLVTTLGSVKRAGQISLVTKGNVNNARNLSGGRKALSDLKFGVHEFPEARSYLEDLGEYQTRMKDDDSNKNADILGMAKDAAISSGRRTEIATGIYHIQRQN